MISIENLSKSFGALQVLDDISFRVEKGEFLVILGSSGAGKSTLLRCINGLNDVTAGKVVIAGKEITSKNRKDIRKKAGFIFQSSNIVGNMSVLKNVMTGTLGSKHPINIFFSKEDKRAAEEALEVVGLKDKLYERADSLSGGEKQRVAIARVLVQKPEIILADEPVASLDPVTGHGIMELLFNINQSRNTTVVCNLHQLQYAEKYGKRIIGIKEGKICFDKKPEKIIKEDYKNIYGENVEIIA